MTLMKSSTVWSPGARSSTLSSHVREYRSEGVTLHPEVGAVVVLTVGVVEKSPPPPSCPASAGAVPGSRAAAAHTTSIRMRGRIAGPLVGDDDRVAGVDVDGRAAANRFFVVEARHVALARLADDLDVLRVG